ncbi:hypothetical protein [uncultured Methanobrevibacter sp.]|uniref:hypothetical protein n=1 Tax=uncultured Methanobrevibacter sp. TaxID=253161 RepID=UPI0025EE24DA|nr:hypothetical protein [uncultured Methanobrevibacter sp.]
MVANNWLSYTKFLQGCVLINIINHSLMLFNCLAKAVCLLYMVSFLTFVFLQFFVA